jgi:UDP-N-acetylglucosamine:LPS N-acetylglucosamine transferase
VINDKIELPEDMHDKTYFIAHAERNFLVVKNLIEAYRILKKEKVDVIFSTGAGPVVPFAIIGKLFFKTKVVFIETITRINKPSLTARLMYPLSDYFMIQWDSLKKYFPKADVCGPLL